MLLTLSRDGTNDCHVSLAQGIRVGNAALRFVRFFHVGRNSNADKKLTDLCQHTYTVYLFYVFLAENV